MAGLVKVIDRRFPNGQVRELHPEESANRPWLWKSFFRTKKEILDHWWALLAMTQDSIWPTCEDKGLNLQYCPGTGWRYTVTLAGPDDGEDLSVLASEFVRSHAQLLERDESELFRDVPFGTWCKYLGLASDTPPGKQVGRRVNGKSAVPTRFDFESSCQRGCILKCVAEADDFEELPTRRIRRQGSTTSNYSAASGRSKPSFDAKTGLVGYVHFTMEESPPDKKRSSKRLKRKRGEPTGEYIKVSHLLVTRSHRCEGLGIFLLAAVLHRVKCLDPTFAHELFLTVVQRNEAAVGLYQRMGLEISGENTTYLAQAQGDQSRPVVWYQMTITSEGISASQNSNQEKSDSEKELL